MPSDLELAGSGLKTQTATCLHCAAASQAVQLKYLGALSTLVQCNLRYFLCWFWLWLFLYLLSKWHLADFATEVVKSKQQNPGNQIGDSDPG